MNEGEQRKKKPAQPSADQEPQVAQRRQVEKPAQGVEPDDEEGSDVEEALPYQTLTQVTHKVSRQAIGTRWGPLNPGCVASIIQLMDDIQKPAIAHIQHDQKKLQASQGLQMLTRKILKKVSRGPFPPSTRIYLEDDFNFEKILDHNRSLAAQLTPVLHANELLEAELKKETALLELDQGDLEDLESNAKAHSALRKKAAKNVHSLLEETSVEGDESDHICLRTAPSLATPFDVSQDQTPLSGPQPDFPQNPADDDVQAVIAQLGGHMDSIEGNMKQVQGVTGRVATVKAAVQATLFNRLEIDVYQDIVLG